MTFFRKKSMRVLPLMMCTMLLLSACQTTAVYTSDVLKRQDENLSILVMPMDVTLTEMSFGGALAVRADWSENATDHLQNALNEFLAKLNANTIPYTQTSVAESPKSPDVQLVKLFSTVAKTISVHHYNPAMQLPSKEEAFDWTLGPDVMRLAASHDADYALFISVEDSYASAERVVAMAAAAILFGVSLQGGRQQGYAALVDLRTGDVAWFNQLFRGTGDIRTAEPAHETINALMTEFPK